MNGTTHHPTWDSTLRTGLKGSAVIMWTITISLFLSGLRHRGNPIHYYAWGCLTGMIAMTLTGIAALMWQIRKACKARQREHIALAGETARALADELEERDLVQTGDNGNGGSVTSIR